MRPAMALSCHFEEPIGMEEVRSMDDRNSSIPHHILILLVVISCSFFLLGCGRIGIKEEVPAPPAEVSKVDIPLSAEHDLAILAIDFNPPLNDGGLWAEWGEVTLLIAVENRGLSPESGVRISAKLSAPRRSEVLMQRSTILEGLAPGEVQVVRVAGISNVPYRSSYRLEVEVLAVDGEWVLVNNIKIYELTVKEPPQASDANFRSPLQRQ